ncbi:hypothetical protein VP01_711g4 [Puccinia sorghi]|uniref:Uncharacterized protein n=1 Tax=Puccinia sorghi TaxID=27349 RepID=A0A0L6UDI3_9BASI|nr:hypothetical protein VP01_711g4 [Puccinia sorghi]
MNKKGKKTAKNPTCYQSSQVINLAQDLDKENSKVKCKPQRRDPDFYDVKNFVSEQYFCKGDPDNKPLSTYKCLWYMKAVCESGSSLLNLLTHQDGSCQTGRVSDGCPQHQKAIDKGSNLPATSLHDSKTKTDTKEGSISSHFNQAENSDKKNLNRILSMLIFSFQYCEPGSELFKQKWAATSGCVIYLNLQEVLNYLNVCHSLHYQNFLLKFNLIHDVWKTKGKHFGFIGASVSFIDNDWNYIIQHLSLKLVSWHHKHHPKRGGTDCILP